MGHFPEYETLSDEVLCELAKHDARAEEALLIRYKPLVRKEARTLFLTWGDKEDLIQEGMIGLYQAVHRYRAEAGQFAAFARKCILGQMYHAITTANRKKNLPMQRYVSLDSPEFASYEDGQQYIQAGEHQSDPEKQWIAREEANRLRQTLDERLSKMERQVLEEYMEGRNYAEIAKRLSKNPKSIDNAIQRIRVKMKQILDEETKNS